MKNLKLNYLIIVAILVSAIFTSCDKEDDDDSKSVSGTIEGTHASWDEVSVSFDDGKTKAATAKISNGKFSIKLPVPNAASFIPIESDMPPGVTISDKSAKVAPASFFVHKGSDKEEIGLMRLSLATGTLTMVGYVYVDKKVDVSGSFTEEGENMVFDLKMNKGWNTMVIDINILNESMKAEIAPAPSGATWLAL